MRILRLTGLLMMLLLATVAAAETEQETSSAMPVAVAEQAKQTLPAVLEGTEVRHDFVIRNTGDAPLEIEKVKSG